MTNGKGSYSRQTLESVSFLIKACTAFLKACVKTISLGMAVVVVCPKMIDLTCAERLLCVSLGYKILSCQDKLKFIDFYTYPLLYNNKPLRTEKYFHE